jgi:hypothetical protein
MPVPTLADLEAELQWRLAQTITDRGERARNEARIAELDRQIAEMRQPRPEGPAQPAADASSLLVAVLVLFVIFFLFLSV